MEKEMIKLVQENVKKELTYKLKCNIKIHYINDTFYIDIEQNYKPVFKYSVTDVPTKILNNVTSKIIAYEVLNAFKKHLLSKYFK